MKYVLFLIMLIQLGCIKQGPDQADYSNHPLLRAEVVSLGVDCVVSHIEGRITIGIPEKGFIEISENHEIKYGIYYYFSKNSLMEVTCVGGKNYKLGKQNENIVVIFEKK